MRKIPLDELSALGTSGPHALCAVEDAFDWSSGSKGPRIGTNYSVIRPADMEKVKVRVPDSAPVVAAEAVAKYIADMQFIYVTFDGFTASVSVDRTGNLRIYAEAESIRVVRPQAGGQKE